MKKITIILTDAEYSELMAKVNQIHGICSLLTDKPLRRAKSIIGMCAALNLKRNIEMFSRAFNGS